MLVESHRIAIFRIREQGERRARRGHSPAQRICQQSGASIVRQASCRAAVTTKTVRFADCISAARLIGDTASSSRPLLHGILPVSGKAGGARK